MEKYTGMSNQHTVRGKCDVYMNQTQPNYPAIYLVDQSLVEPKLALLLRASQTEGRPQKQSCRFLARSAISYFPSERIERGDKLRHLWINVQGCWKNCRQGCENVPSNVPILYPSKAEHDCNTLVPWFQKRRAPQHMKESGRHISCTGWQYGGLLVQQHSVVPWQCTCATYVHKFHLMSSSRLSLPPCTRVRGIYCGGENKLAYFSSGR